ncbi:MAG: hypothetical protein J6J11_06405 [Treponema sp.]|nr:hypothetical protein [Clostridia bacterium]MBP3607930.1 hypothetical protein [Treponema sp.]
MNQEQIKELLLKGFDKELIAFEFDIELAEIEKVAQEIEEDFEKTLKDNTTTTSVKPKAVRKRREKFNLEKLKEKYQEIYSTSSELKENMYDSLSSEQKEGLSFYIAKAKSIVNKMPSEKMKDKESKHSRVMQARDLMTEIKKILKYPLTVKYAEEVYNLLHSDKLLYLGETVDKSFMMSVNDAIKLSIERLAQALNIEYLKTDKIEELTKLRAKITVEMIKENPMAINVINSKILEKINKIKRIKAKKEMERTVPNAINEIAIRLAKGTMVAEEANRIIDEEASKQTEDEEDKSVAAEKNRRYYLVYIADCLMERADEFYIEDPVSALRQIQDLSMVETGKALKIISTNLVERHDYTRAKELCEAVDTMCRGENIYKTINSIRKEIESKELTYFVLNTIKESGNVEDQKQGFEFLQKAINSGKIAPKTISLGKTEDGSRMITLADIWEGTPKKEI